jgi:hypothetical protein
MKSSRLFALLAATTFGLAAFGADAKQSSTPPKKAARPKYVRVQRTGWLNPERVEVSSGVAFSNTTTFSQWDIQRSGRADIGSLLGSRGFSGSGR